MAAWGFAKHYAASFATLMRLAGIPARIVVGYLGGAGTTIWATSFSSAAGGLARVV